MLSLLKKGTEDQLGYINRNIDYYCREYDR
jgi:hypothetical protein